MLFRSGRPIVLTEEKKELAFEALQDRNKRVKDIAKALGVGEATIFRFQRKLRGEGKLNWTVSKNYD